MPMVERIGAKAAIFGANSSAQDSQSLGNHVVLPSLPPPFDSVLAIVGLQLLTYHIALQRHTNPDSFRLDDVRYLEANKLVNK
jgi:glucosamine 6-phosphate synthetase-like amidotransferase/phosphosugar isomerase protein